jgi:hypothetical protein
LIIVLLSPLDAYAAVRTWQGKYEPNNFEQCRTGADTQSGIQERSATANHILALLEPSLSELARAKPAAVDKARSPPLLGFGAMLVAAVLCVSSGGRRPF